MGILVTGSSGHLGEALVRTLRAEGQSVRGIDLVPSEFTDLVGSLVEPGLVERAMLGMTFVIHTATLHKPHVATHSKSDFVQANVQGTLNLLEAAAKSNLSGFVFTSTTSAFGSALSPLPGEPAAWITEEVQPIPKNIYGVTKIAAEDLCQLFAKTRGLPTIILRTSRFFFEDDDSMKKRSEYDDTNLKANEFLNRRVDIEDVVKAHLLALDRIGDLGFGKFIISATTPFERSHRELLRNDAPALVKRLFPQYQDLYQARGWKMNPTLDRIYVNKKARHELGWQPVYDFAKVLESLKNHQVFWSPMALKIGAKGYHPGRTFRSGPYPVHQ